MGRAHPARLQEATGLDKVQKLLGIKRVSMGTLSESAGVFDPEPLREAIGELASCTIPVVSGRDAEALEERELDDDAKAAGVVRDVVSCAMWCSRG